MSKKVVGGVLSAIGGCVLLISIVFGKTPMLTAYGFGEALVIYFVPLAMLIGGAILISNK